MTSSALLAILYYTIQGESTDKKNRHRYKSILTVIVYDETKIISLLINCFGENTLLKSFF